MEYRNVGANKYGEYVLKFGQNQRNNSHSWWLPTLPYYISFVDPPHDSSCFQTNYLQLSGSDARRPVCDASQNLRSGGMTCRQMVLSANFSSLCRRRTGYVWKLFEKKIFVKSGSFLQKNWKNLVKLQNKLGKTTKVPRAFSTGLFLTVFFTRSIIKLSYIHEQNTKETRRDFKPPAVCPNGSGPGKRSC